MKKFKHTTTNRLNCPIQLTSDLIGDKWTLLILRELFLGNTKFGEFQEHLGISKSVLTDKLKQLESAGLVERKEYKEEKKRARKEYFLSNTGGELIFTMSALMMWGNKHRVNQGDTFLKLVDEKGTPIQLVFTDQAGNHLSMDEIRFELS